MGVCIIIFILLFISTPGKTPEPPAKKTTRWENGINYYDNKVLVFYKTIRRKDEMRVRNEMRKRMNEALLKTPHRANKSEGFNTAPKRKAHKKSP